MPSAKDVLLGVGLVGTTALRAKSITRLQFPFSIHANGSYGEPLIQYLIKRCTKMPKSDRLPLYIRYIATSTLPFVSSKLGYFPVMQGIKIYACDLQYYKLAIKGSLRLLKIVRGTNKGVLATYSYMNSLLSWAQDKLPQQKWLTEQPATKLPSIQPPPQKPEHTPASPPPPSNDDHQQEEVEETDTLDQDPAQPRPTEAEDEEEPVPSETPHEEEQEEEEEQSVDREVAVVDHGDDAGPIAYLKPIDDSADVPIYMAHVAETLSSGNMTVHVKTTLASASMNVTVSPNATTLATVKVVHNASVTPEANMTRSSTRQYPTHEPLN